MSDRIAGLEKKLMAMDARQKQIKEELDNRGKQREHLVQQAEKQISTLEHKLKTLRVSHAAGLARFDSETEMLKRERKETKDRHGDCALIVQEARKAVEEATAAAAKAQPHKG